VEAPICISLLLSPLQLNDWYALINAVPATGLCLYGFLTPGLVGSLCFGGGLGITLFGISYMFVHGEWRTPQRQGSGGSATLQPNCTHSVVLGVQPPTWAWPCLQRPTITTPQPLQSPPVAPDASDGLVHRRFPVGPIAELPYMKRVMVAHKLHHSEKYGGVPYGLFLGAQVGLGWGDSGGVGEGGGGWGGRAVARERPAGVACCWKGAAAPPMACPPACKGGEGEVSARATAHGKDGDRGSLEVTGRDITQSLCL
jgi:hypothetical protein